MTNYQSKWARAHTNIALIKYWGKENEDIILPKNNSLSLTLDAFYTETKVVFDSSFTEDQLFINGELEDLEALKKVKVVLDLAREKSGHKEFAHVESYNFVPTAAGLASSASGLAALAGACNDALQLNLNRRELSMLARRGSGSACRSIYGGFVEWEKGIDHESSYAQPIDDAEWDIGMLFMVLEEKRKEVSSRVGMKHTVDTSPFYPVWLDTLNEDLKEIKKAIDQQDINRLGSVAEANALKMHATNLGAKPPFTYWNDKSMIAMDQVRSLRKQGFSVYFTMDAGPNVKLIGKASELEAIRNQLLSQYSKDQLIIAKAGPGLALYDEPTKGE